MRRLLVLALPIYAALSGAQAPSSIVGTWTAYIDLLPALQLPQVPLLGNGHLGVALNSVPRAGAAVGPGSANALDIWLDTTSFWSCTECGGVDPDNDVPACCSTVAFGGVSVRLTPTFPQAAPLPSFYAEQRIAVGTLYTAWHTPAGGVFETLTVVHPTEDITVTNCTWSPASGDPAQLTVELSTWVLGDGRIPGSWNTGTPAPARVGCTSADGATDEPCVPWSAARNGSPASSSLPPPPQLVFASRNASTVAAQVMPVTAALASGALLGPGAQYLGANVTSQTAAGSAPTVPWEATLRLALPGGSWAALVTVEAESRGPGLADPVPAAAAALAAVLAAPPTAVASAAALWWAAFWQRSSVSLPSRPAIERYWAGAQYILACTSSASAAVPGPGLYGPWVTADGPNWHGDYTADYNVEAPYFGVFGSNHAEQAAAFYGPIVDWMGPARTKAQAQAALARVACPAHALYYACHLAPWGLMSLDPMTRYMSWNGPYAALPFINAFEYTRDAAFAAAVTYPLLDGLNAWWACYLNRTATGPGPGDYEYDDVNSFNPDYEHEGQRVPNPQIALAFAARTIAAQLDMAAQLGLPPPPAALQDIAGHLAPLNTAPVNYSTSVNFTVLNDTRCHGDEQTWYGVAGVGACEHLCALDAACAAFSYCPPLGTPGCSGSDGQPQPLTCWAYPAQAVPGSNCVTNATANAGWTSGLRTPGGAATATVWTAFRGAGVGDSDSFALYAAWPTEAVEPLAPGLAADAAAALRGVAQASSYTYSDFVSGRPVDLFASAVRAGTNASFPLSWVPAQVLAGMDGFLARASGPSLLPYAPGGGIENVGITRFSE